MQLIKEFEDLLRLQGKEKNKYIRLTIGTCLSFIIFKIIVSFASNKLVDGVMYNDQELRKNALILTLAGMIIACFVYPILMYIRGKIIRNSVMNIRKSVIQRTLNYSMTFYDKGSSSNVMMQFMYNVNVIEETYGEIIRGIFRDLIFGAASIVVIGYLSFKVLIVIITIGILSSVINRQLMKCINECTNTTYKKYNSVVEKMGDIYSGVKEIKIFGLNQHLMGNFHDVNQNYEKESIHLNNLWAYKDGIEFGLKSISYIFLIIYCSYLVGHSEMTVGYVVNIILLYGTVITMFLVIGNMKGQLSKSFVAKQAIKEYMNEPTEDKLFLLQDNETKTDTENAIEFQHVDFKYAENSFGMKDMCLSVKKGEHVAFVGQSGSGKSTATKLALGLYLAQKGKVFVNGMLIHKDNIEKIRQDISYIPQNGELFSGTIMENIKYGNLNATDEEVYKWCEFLSLQKHILSLPEKYDTYIGEERNIFSGGERQRLTIARALVRKASIFILDEVTSALDVKNSDDVGKLVETVLKDKTVIIVTHKIKSIEQSDRIFVFQNGSLIEEGTSEELKKKENAYYDLYISYANAKESLEIETVEVVADKGYESREDILNCVMNGIVPM